MKPINILRKLAASLLLMYAILLCTSCSDPCASTVCDQFTFSNVNNDCIDGICRCEVEGFGALDLSILCENCTVDEKLSVDLFIDGELVDGLDDIFSPTPVRLHYDRYSAGSSSYEIRQIVTGTLLDSGQMTFSKCEEIQLLASVSQ